jgi:hypothetical protein
MSKIQLLAGLVQRPTGLISLLCQLLDPRLELLQHRRRLFRRRGLLRQFGSLVRSKVMFQVRLLGLQRCKRRHVELSGNSHSMRVRRSAALEGLG